MPLLQSLKQSLSAKSWREAQAYLRSISGLRIAILATAMFLNSAATGLFVVIDTMHKNQPRIGLALAAYAGLIGAVYVLALMRRPWWMLPAMALWFASLAPLAIVLKHSAWMQYQTSLAATVHIYSFTGWVCSVLSYSFIFAFIQTEGMSGFRARTELALAQTIQKTLVPAIDIVAGGCQIWGISVPSEKVGGDLVDVVALPDGTAVAYIADVAGHGLNAGILMGMVKAAARATITETSGPHLLLENLNRVLPGVKEAHMYATCVAFRFGTGNSAAGSPAVSTFDFSVAGHPAILHLSADGQARPSLTDHSFPLGLMPSPGYRSLTVPVSRGDMLVAATDGVLEVAGKDGAEFGEGALERLVAANASLPLNQLAERILAEARARGPQEDDQTLLLIRAL